MRKGCADISQELKKRVLLLGVDKLGFSFQASGEVESKVSDVVTHPSLALFK